MGRSTPPFRSSQEAEAGLAGGERRGQGWGAGEETAEEEGLTSADSGDIRTPVRVLGGGTSPLPRFPRLGQGLGCSEGLQALLLSQFSRSVASDSLRPHGLQHARPPCRSPTPSLLKLMSIESVMPSNSLIRCHPLLFPPSIFPSVRVFSNESILHIRWPEYWSFSISPSNESVQFSSVQSLNHVRFFADP